MTRRVVFRPEAEDEVLETRGWYEQRREGLGAEFASAVDAMVEHIVMSPLAFPCAHGETRRAVLRRFPYAIYSRSDGSRNCRSGGPWAPESVALANAFIGIRTPDLAVFLAEPSDEVGKTWA